MLFKLVFLSLLITLVSARVASPARKLKSSQDDAIFEAIYESLEKNRDPSVKPKADEICYGELGCFNSKTGPLKHNNRLPNTPEEVKTRFLLNVNVKAKKSSKSKSKNQRQVTEIKYDDESTLSSFPNGSSLAIIIHGFGSNPDGVDQNKIKDGLLNSGKAGAVIMVDWSKGATSPDYVRAVANTELVGRQLALLLNKLKINRSLKPSEIHLIGHSLGAQISGFAGKSTREIHGWQIGRITGLDAAAPSFEGYPGSHLIKGDATFVDGIHTAMGSNILFGELGFVAAYGDVDFYPNGGKKQPACSGSLSISCNHGMCVKYYEASLSSAIYKCANGFESLNCESWDDYQNENDEKCNGGNASQMGHSSVELSGTGKQFLATGKAYPYCSV